MVRTKQTARGGTSHRPEGMATATVTGTGRSKAGPEEQFIDAQGDDTEEDFPLVLEDAQKQPKEGKPGVSKPKGKKPVQAAEGAEAPPEETPSDPESTKPHTEQPLQNPGQAPARLPLRTLPRPPMTNPPCPPPQTQTRMNPQLPPSMLRRTSSRQRMVRFCSKGRGNSVHQVV